MLYKLIINKYIDKYIYIYTTYDLLYVHINIYF